jgi:fatty acid desaturase
VRLRNKSVGDGVSGCTLFLTFLKSRPLINPYRNLPIGFVAFVLIFIFLKIENKRTPMALKARLMQLDPLGAVMLLASVVCLLLALQWGGQAHPWNSATIIGLFIGFGLLFILFSFIQWKMGENATIPLRVLKQRSILSASAFLFFIAMSNYVASFGEHFHRGRTR